MNALSSLHRHWTVLRESWKHRKDMADEKRHVHELEFMPAALEVQQMPPSPIGRIISWIVILFFVLAVVWAYFGKVNIVAVAHGKIIPSGKTKVIQPLEIGKVKAIHVHDGQTVQRGDLLIELDATLVTADHTRIEKEYQLSQASLARTMAMLNGISKSVSPIGLYNPPENIHITIVNAQKEVLKNQYQEYKSQQLSFAEEIKKTQAERDAIDESVKKLADVLPLITERANSYKKLSQSNLVAKNEYYELEQERIESAQDLASFKKRSVETEQAIKQVRAQRASSKAEVLKSIAQEKSELEARVAGLEQEIIKADNRMRIQTIAAPIDGIVQQLAVHTIGGVVTPAQQLMMLVPIESQLEAEVFIENKDIGFVEANQEAEIKVDAFPFTKYGTIYGEILNVSTDAVENEQKGWVFPSKVSLAETAIKVRDKYVNLTPGMSVTVEVKTGKRRVIEFFLSPLLRYRQESIKER